MIRIRKHGTVVASFATPQEIVIDHANDDIRVGDGTDLMGPLTNVGGTLCFPVDIKQVAAGTLATSTNQTNGTQRTKVTDGTDNVEIETVGAEKALKVAVISTVGGGAAPAHTDDAGFTVGTDQVTMCGALYDDTATDSVDEGDGGALRMTADRLLKIQLAGVLAGISVPVTDNAGSLTIDNANLDAALSTLATATKQDTIIGHLDGVEGLLTTIDADTGGILTAVQLIDDTVGTLGAALPAKGLVAAGSDGTNAVALKVDAAGELQVDVLSSALPTGAATSAKQDTQITHLATLAGAVAGTEMQVDVLTMPTTTVQATNLDIRDLSSASDSVAAVATGAAAHDAAVSGNPVRIGGYAMNTSVTKVANGDTANLITDLQGALVVMPVRPREFVRTQTTAITNTTETTVVTAGGAGVYNDIVGLIITNNSDVQSLATLKDSTAGTTRMVFLVPARGGVVFCPCTPLAQQAAANNNWTITMGTTATATNVSVMYVIQT